MRAICAIVASLVLAGTTFANTINVPGDYPTIQGAVDAANNSDEILVAPGTYTGTGDWVINPGGKAITIQATGSAEETILDGEGVRRVVLCTGGEGSDTVIKGFTITGGSASSGGGIWCNNSSPTITDCTISNNTASVRGGGISCNQDGNPTITGCTISNNTASGTAGDGGGISCFYSYPTITDCTISDNTANEYSGGIYCLYSDPTISGCMISGNTASEDGGGIYCYNSNPTITDTTVCGNDPDQIYGKWTDNGGNYVHEICPVVINVPDDYPYIQWAIDASYDGYIIQIAPGTYNEQVLDPNGRAITIQGTLNSDGSLATTVGGKFQFNSSETSNTVLKNLVITKEGTSWTGQGINIFASSPTIVGCTITNNTSEGINISGGSNPTGPKIIDCTITSNGTGIYCWVNANITGCLISGHGYGGIKCNSADPTISNCTIINNTNDNAKGGGIDCYNGSNPTITHCTISGNSTGENGGGISCIEGSSPIISGCTITNNNAQEYGGGLFILDTSIPTIEDTTVCGNTPSQLLGTWVDDGGNLIAEECSGGACCLEEECSVTTDSDCMAAGGTYLGDGTGCSADPCNGPPGPGACCTNNNCIVVQEADCLLFFGQWLGDGTNCDDVDCPTSCLGDANGDGEVSVNDILLVISQYGVTCP
ncbi:MAG: right-handed parallel beta-helix repeat-containing protein [Planctomycetota bacterium]|nr:right-handed parallel beta-helix repeat-containing protein [Planctomycetota bacterium]